MFTLQRLERLLIAGAIVALPIHAFAQEAVVTGSVTDTTGGVLPGATVVAVHESTGNKFLAVTDTRGMFRLPVRTGGFKVTMQMTLTAPGCGMGPAIAEDATGKLLLVPGVDDAEVNLTWDPPWNQGMISEEGKMKLGLI